MSKSSLIIGIVISLVAHWALFLPVGSGKADTPSDKREPYKGAEPAEVRLSKAPRQTPATIDPKPAQQPPSSGEAKRQLKKVVSKSAEAPDARQREGAESQSEDKEQLPALRIAWQSAGQLRQVARLLGMRVVAVNAQGEVVGQVTTSGDARLEDFTDDLASFSNRVRTLPKAFFGSGLTLPTEARALWILVPVDLDQSFIDVQKEAVSSHGIAFADARMTEGRFEERDGSFELVITSVHGS